MRKCKQIIELASDNMDTSLSWLTWVEMKLHFMMCASCRRYAKQLQFMHKALSVMGTYNQSKQLPEPAKQRIAEKMHQAKKALGK